MKRSVTVAVHLDRVLYSDTCRIVADNRDYSSPNFVKDFKEGRLLREEFFTVSIRSTLLLMITMRILSGRLQVIVLNSGTWELNRSLHKASDTEDWSFIGALLALTCCIRSVQASLRYNNVATGYGLDNQEIEVRFPVRAIQIFHSESAAAPSFLRNG
jgi:hypothetical protein